MQRGEVPRPNIAKALNSKIVGYDEAEGTLDTEFDINERFLNPAGHVQGGILTAMLDGTMGPANGMVLGDNEFAPTLNINVSFINPAPAGKFHCKGRVVSKGRSICYLAGELFDADGNLVATATATAKVARLN